jgi:hypothetical protein
VDVLNFVEEKIFFEGIKLILVPVFFVVFANLSGLTDFPSLNEIKYSF